MIQTFTFWFLLAVTVLVYWLLPSRLRLGFLALASFGYTLALDPLSAVILGVWTVLFFRLLPPQRAPESSVVTLLILSVLGLLFYFKYLPPLMSALIGATAHPLTLPLGISFFTFKLVHFAVEAARGNVRETSLSRLAAYLFLFPIFTAGPIERYEHFQKHLEDRPNLQSMVEGTTRIAHGLVKRFLVAPWLLPYADLAFLVNNFSQLSSGQVWSFLVASYLVLYLDFSAYTDIAVGASRLYGIRIMENFNFPVLATNISDFWKRWHISLATWCQTYVYLPLIGLTRNPYAAIYATFVVMGLWHEGTLARLFWGLYHATGVAAHLTWTRLARRRRWRFESPAFRPLGWAATFLFVSGGLAFGVVDFQPNLGLRESLKILGRALGLY